MKLKLLFTLLFLPTFIFADYEKGVKYAESGNFKLANIEFLKAADQGNVNAQFAIAASYYFGDGVEINYTLAKKYFDLSANQGYAESNYFIALMYENGEGVKQNNKLAFNHYLTAAQACITIAQNQLSYFYYTGKGTEKDEIEAAAWLYVSQWIDQNEESLNGLTQVLKNTDDQYRKKPLARQVELLNEFDC